MNKWPKSVVSSGKKYQVRYIKTKTDNGGLGQTHYAKKRVLVSTVNDGSPVQPAEMFEYFLHECGHTIFLDNRMLRNVIRDGCGGDDDAVESWHEQFFVTLSDFLLRNGIVTLPDGRPK